MLISILAAGALLMAADTSAATAPVAATSPPGKAEKPAEPRPKLICHLETRPGSHMSERVCLTATQAAEREQESKEAVDSVRRRGSGERVDPAGAVGR